MFSPIASTIFTVRNINKTENGEIGRAPVFIGQAAGVIGEISKYDNAVAVGTKNVLSAFSELSKESKVLNYAGKFAKFASENVNPLIAVSGGVKVLMSDDKQSAAITEASALSAMFLGEALVKKNYDKIAGISAVKSAMSSKCAKAVTDFLQKTKLKGAAGAIVKGVSFVGASIASYEAGHYIGEKLAKYAKNNYDNETTSDEKTTNLQEDLSLAETEHPFLNSDFGKIDQLA